MMRIILELDGANDIHALVDAFRDLTAGAGPSSAPAPTPTPTPALPEPEQRLLGSQVMHNFKHKDRNGHNETQRTFDVEAPDPDVFEAAARRWPNEWFKLSTKDSLAAISACATGIRRTHKEIPEADVRVLYTTARLHLLSQVKEEGE